MSTKFTHLGLIPSDGSKKGNGTPQVGGFVVPLEPDIPSLFQESVESKMRLLANLIIDRMLEDERNGTLKHKINPSHSDSES